MKTKRFYLNEKLTADLKLIFEQGSDPVFPKSQNKLSQTFEQKIDRFYNRFAVAEGFDYTPLDWRFTEIKKSFEAVWLKAPATWGEIKAFLETFTTEELEKEAHILLDDDGHFTKLLEPQRMEEDIYINQDNPEDVGDLESLKDLHEQEFKMENYLLITPKGKPFLWAETS